MATYILDIEGKTQADFIAMRYGYNSIPEQSESERDQFIRECVVSMYDISKARPSWFEQFSVEVLLEFLKLSHRHYLKERIPRIEQTLVAIEKYGTGLVSAYGNVLVQRLAKDLKHHFEYEESNLFPYAEHLSKGISASEMKYSVKEFLENHPETTFDIDKLLAIVSSELELSSGLIAYRVLVKQLENLKKDLKLHEMIEEEVLVEKLKKMERS